MHIKLKFLSVDYNSASSTSEDSRVKFIVFLNLQLLFVQFIGVPYNLIIPLQAKIP